MIKQAPRPTGVIIEYSSATNIARIRPEAGGDDLFVSPDACVDCQFHDLSLGQKVRYEREVQHGPHPHRHQIWAAASVADELEHLDVLPDSFDHLVAPAETT